MKSIKLWGNLPLSSLSIELEEGEPSHRPKNWFLFTISDNRVEFHYHFQPSFCTVFSGIFLFFVRGSAELFARIRIKVPGKSICTSLLHSPSLFLRLHRCCCASISLLFLLVQFLPIFIHKTLKNAKSLTFALSSSKLPLPYFSLSQIKNPPGLL